MEAGVNDTIHVLQGSTASFSSAEQLMRYKPLLLL
jgi:hypothetical protein